MARIRRRLLLRRLPAVAVFMPNSTSELPVTAQAGRSGQIVLPVSRRHRARDKHLMLPPEEVARRKRRAELRALDYTDTWASFLPGFRNAVTRARSRRPVVPGGKQLLKDFTPKATEGEGLHLYRDESRSRTLPTSTARTGFVAWVI